MTNSAESSDAAAWTTLAEFNALDHVTVEKLKPLGRIRCFGEGEILFNEGEHHPLLYFVTKGAARLDMLTPVFGAQTILSVGAGELLAWSSLIGDHIMTATAIAQQDTEAIVFDADKLRQAIDADTDLGYRVMQAIARGLSRRLLATRLQLLDLYGR